MPHEQYEEYGKLREHMQKEKEVDIIELITLIKDLRKDHEYIKGIKQEAIEIADNLENNQRMRGTDKAREARKYANELTEIENCHFKTIAHVQNIISDYNERNNIVRPRPVKFFTER